MVVVRGREEVSQGVRRSVVGTRFGVVAEGAKECAELWELFRKSLGWAGMLAGRDRGGAWFRNQVTGVREYWIYGRVTAGNAIRFTCPAQATPTGGGEERYVEAVA